VWQPIETAPKDGTPVLGFLPQAYQGKGGYEVVLFDPSDGKWWIGCAFWVQPSHWMPLPTPPIDPKKNRENRDS
jgi:hypothetical protein